MKIDNINLAWYCSLCNTKNYKNIRLEEKPHTWVFCEMCFLKLAKGFNDFVLNNPISDFDVEKQRYILKIKELEKKNFDLDFELQQLKTHLFSYSMLIKYAEEQKQKNILVNDTIDRFISDLTKEIRRMEDTSYE